MRMSLTVGGKMEILWPTFFMQSKILLRRTEARNWGSLEVCQMFADSVVSKQ